MAKSKIYNEKVSQETLVREKWRLKLLELKKELESDDNIKTEKEQKIDIEIQKQTVVGVEKDNSAKNIDNNKIEMVAAESFSKGKASKENKNNCVEKSIVNLDFKVVYLYDNSSYCHKNGHNIIKRKGISADTQGKKVSVEYCVDCKRIFLKRSLYRDYLKLYPNLQLNVANKETDDLMIYEEKIEDFVPLRTVYVYRGRLKCHTDHDLKNVCGTIEYTTEDKMSFYVEYCSNCKKYFIKEELYKGYLIKYKFFPIKLQWYGMENNFEKKFADNSFLSLSGYTVNSNTGFSTYERQKILSKLMDANEEIKPEILSYLNQFIKVNGKQINMKNAVSRWTDDMDFVKNYKINKHFQIKIKDIKKHTK